MRYDLAIFVVALRSLRMLALDDDAEPLDLIVVPGGILSN